jgi:hypothetical protein
MEILNSKYYIFFPSMTELSIKLSSQEIGKINLKDIKPTYEEQVNLTKSGNQHQEKHS